MAEFTGYFDNLSENLLAGWAMEGDRPVHIDLVIDNDFVSRNPSVRFREDLKGQVSAHGFCGFNILIPRKFCDGKMHDVELLYSGTLVPLTHGQIKFVHKHEDRHALFVSFPDIRLKELALKCLSLLCPMDVIGGELVRVGHEGDGGYVMLDHGLENAICYSLGINDDIKWDMAMAARGCHIYMYDHTIEFLPENHSNFNWEKVGIAAYSTPDGKFASIPDLIIRNGHENAESMILKCDIEGHEWESFSTTSEQDIAKFSQIVMEIHGFQLIDNDQYMNRLFSVLKKINITHQVIHLHGNNSGIYMLAGGVGMPTTYEVTYVRRNNHQFDTSYKTYPTTLDRPCSEMTPDFYLGPIGLVNWKNNLLNV